MKQQEIERKFLVADSSFIEQATRVYRIAQGYLSLSPTVRVRVRDRDGFLTIKGESDATGLERSEWEYAIPIEEAQSLMQLCGTRLVEKLRYIVPYEGQIWEVDVFEGRHSGLIVAELELERADEGFGKPLWLGREVTGDMRYNNATLSLRDDLPPKY